MQLEIRGVQYKMEDSLREYIERRLGFALGRFADRIGRVTAYLSDINGPRGGIDKRCRISVNLIPRGAVMIEDCDHDPFTLAARGAKRVGRSVRRALERRRRPSG